MSTLLSGIFKWLAWKAATLLLILAILLAGAGIRGELKTAQELRTKHAELVEKRNTLVRQTEELRRVAIERAGKLKSDIRRLEKELADLSRTLKDTRTYREEIWNTYPVWRKIPWSDVSQKIKSLDIEIVARQTVVNEQTRLKKLKEAIVRKELKELDEEIIKSQRDTARADKDIADNAGKLERTFLARLARIISEELPLALGVLVGVILIPVGIKVFLYFIVAPWAAGRPPIRILPSASGSILPLSVEGATESGRGRMSAVSQPVVLGENQELLIQSEYLQSTPVQVGKRTRWLLNASIPFTSLASGMFMLTRVGPAGSAPVVISATKDPLSEVGVIALADGAAFVCQPRSLAGVIQDRTNPIRITRHWRLASLQSWLTLQLRFLVFHGPGQLVMKGCRGIRIESAGTGRLINQAATLGFSANLDYANTRCETFVSYWTGREDLFNDLFAGEAGVYVYEEMPVAHRATGITGRGLQGLTDAILKVFGV